MITLLVEGWKGFLGKEDSGKKTFLERNLPLSESPDSIEKSRARMRMLPMHTV